ncbi:MAG TPA: glycosyltransferase [Spirochaetota bacterium]|nr:glycosyltransferase [Spirochaetota bacterium]HOL56256.1 glycosyltransferase [Spirochaetota bacterium]HPP04390.1 glycosyltransferase [Spirochaetota bacterium]
MEKKKLRIAYFMDNFFPQVNGVVTSSINTCFEMARRGHEIFGVTIKPEDFKDYPEDYFPFPVYFQDGFPAEFYPDFYFTYPFDKNVFIKIKEFNPDIIHFHAPFTIGYQAIRIARKLKVPVVGTFHTFFAEKEYLSIVGLEKWTILQKIGWWYSNNFFNRCDAVVSPGIQTAKILKENGLKSYLEIISNGVDVDKYKNFNFKNDLNIEIKDDEQWILYVGRVSKEKCIDTLIDAVEIAMNKNSKIRLLVVGGGPYISQLEKIAINKKIRDKIVITGLIPNKKLLESGIFKKMKVFVTASTSENQPMTILEAIMFGLPIIGVNARGVPELIEDNGFIVEPNNPEKLAEKILELLSCEELRLRFSKKSLELSEKYNIKNTSDKMETLYYRLIEAKIKNLNLELINLTN